MTKSELLNVAVAAGWGALQKELGALKEGQALEAKRSQNLIARNEALELRCGVLDDKLELIVSMLSSMRSKAVTDENGSPSKSFANRKSSMIRNGAEEVARPDGQLIHRRRKTKATLAGVVAMQRMSAASKSIPLADGQRSAPPPASVMSGGSSNVLGMLSAVAAAQERRQASRAAPGFSAERAELRTALDA